MLTFFTIVHVLLCVFMIFVILLQPGKDAGMGAALGGGAATSAFGGRGAVTFLTKVTAVCAVLFFCTSLGLSFVGLKASVVAGIEEPVKAAANPSPPSTPIPAQGVAPGQPGQPVVPANQAQPAQNIPTPQTLPAAPAPQAAPTTQPVPVPGASAPAAAPKAAAPAAPAARPAAPAGQPTAPAK